MEYLLNVLQAVLGIINEMSPYLLLGFLLAGVMHAFIPGGWYARYLSGNTFRSVVNAALFGVPLPLCSCGVIPTAMSLRREGASKGAVVSFLIATPQTGVDSIFATYSLMGLPFAVVRPVAAFLTALLGGTFVNMAPQLPKGEGLRDAPNTNMDSMDNRHAHAPKTNAASALPLRGLGGRIVDALRFGFVEMMEDIGKWLVVGLVVAGLITALVPDSFFAIFKDNTLLSMLLVLCISVPMYICATGSIPIAVALMMKGLTPGAALVMLMAGPACNVASILVINKVLGRKTLVLYLAAIICGSVGFGIVIDHLLPRAWFTDHLMSSHACCHDVASWFEWLCTGILALLLLNVLRMRLMHKPACGCGHDHGGHCHCHGDHDDCGCEDEAGEPCASASVQTYRVEGMNCNHCKTNVAKAIGSVRGVTSVEVDLPGGTATVTGDGLDEAAICAAVESIGYEISLTSSSDAQ